MIDKLFFVILVLNATSLFAFLAPRVGVEIGTISIVLLALNVYYLIVKARYSVPLFLRGSMIGWLFVLVLWPLATVVYAPSINVRLIGLALYYFSLLLGTVVYTVANGLPAMHRMLSVSLAISVVGMVLSMLMPEYFESVALISAGQTAFKERAFGFSMQPNILAQSLGLLFIGWFSLLRRKNGLSEVVAILVFLLVMLLTGSRLGILIAVIAVTVGLAYSWRKRLVSKKYLLKMCLLAVCLVLGVVGVRHYISTTAYFVNGSEGGLIDRMETILHFKLSRAELLKDDGSIKQRIAIFAIYCTRISEKPLLGYGLGSEAYYVENGIFFTSAHSNALKHAMEYGVPYLFAFVLLMFQLYRKDSRHDVEGVFRTNSISQFVVVVLFLFAVGSFLNLRTFYVVLGMFFAAVYYPHLLFEYNAEDGTPQSCMSRKDIRNARLIKRKSLFPQDEEEDI